MLKRSLLAAIFALAGTMACHAAPDADAGDAAAAVAESDGGEFRTWTTKGGKTLEARMVELQAGGKLSLLGRDGKRRSISLNALSAEDQAYVASRKAKKSPPAGAAKAEKKAEKKTEKTAEKGGEKKAEAAAAAPASVAIDKLALWLDASEAATVVVADGKVAEWRDRSPGQQHAVQGTPDFRPTLVPGAAGSRPMVRFTASGYQEGMHGFQPYLGHFLQSPCIPARGDAPRTIVIAVANVGFTEWLINHMWHYGSPAPLEAYGLTSRSGQKNFWGNHYWSGGFDSQIASDTPGGFIVAQRYSDGEDRFTVNGGTTVRNAVALKTAGGTYGTYGMLIGGRIDPRFGKPTEGAVFDMGEMLAFSKALDEQELRAVEGYLAHKWGMVDRLPPEHPYKTRPPRVTFP